MPKENNNFDSRIEELKKRVETSDKKYSNTMSKKNSIFDLTITIIALTAFGLFIDIKSNAKPLFTLLFLFISFIGGFYNLYKDLSKNNKK